MSDIQFDFDDAHKFAAILATAPAIVESEMLAATNRITLQGEAWAKGLTPVRTGHLRRSIAAKPAVFAGGTVTGSFGTATPYGRFVEFGRRAIQAPPGHVLRFTIGGRVIFASRVGLAKARPFIRPTVDRLRPLVPREYAAALQRVVNKVRQATG